MGVIVELQIPTHQFEFGRRFPTRVGDATDIERVNAVGDGSVPVFSFSEPADDRLDGGDPFSDADGYRLEFVDALDDRELCIVSWDPDADPFFRTLDDHGGSVRRGTGTPAAWTFEAEFPGHDDFSAFRSACDDLDASVEIQRVYNPTSVGTGPWYGLTPRQRKTLELAVERGYYDIPRRCTTIELADDLGISDQAVTERLRRGIVTFVTNALLLDDDD
jgi:predicted DNA binding protein